MGNINKKEITLIFEKMKQQKEAGFNELYSKYNKLVQKIAYSVLKNEEESEDLSQIVFAKIYELPKEKLPSTNASSWLYSVTKNEAITYIKKKKECIDLDSIYNISSEDKEINDILEKDSFNRLINKLPEKEKEIVSLKILSQMSFKDIGNMLNMPTATAQWHYYKATNLLKILIGNISMFIIAIGAYIKSKVQKKIANSAEMSEDKFIGENVIENSQNQTITNETEVEIEQNTIQPDLKPEEANITNTVLLCSTTIFLILTIIFIIISKKYQQISNKKKSK